MGKSPRNRASDRACQAFHLLGDLEFMRAEREHPGGLFSPDVVREDRRRLVGTPTTRTAAEFVDQLETWFDLADTPPVFNVTEVMAVRGDLCALIRCRVTFGDQATEFLNVFRNDVDDVVQKSVLFDPDDLDAALTELDLIQTDTIDTD
jgi:hypothetical protein